MPIQKIQAKLFYFHCILIYFCYINLKKNRTSHRVQINFREKITEQNKNPLEIIFHYKLHFSQENNALSWEIFHTLEKYDEKLFYSSNSSVYMGYFQCSVLFFFS